jgi:hypothetical protein
MIAERVRHEVESNRVPLNGDHQERVTVSIGVATLAEAPASLPPDSLADQLVATADRQLYRAKAGGRNRVAAAPAQMGRRDIEPGSGAPELALGGMMPRSFAECALPIHPTAWVG